MAADDPTPGVEWTDAEREAVVAAIYDSRAFPEGTLGRDEQVRRIRAALAALAPFVAERERQAAERAWLEGVWHGESCDGGMTCDGNSVNPYRIERGEQP